jgi:pimeloyl-ACP methyl ester carboxylesterase
MWELPEYAAFLDRLGSFRRVIMLDKRGTGMSDRAPSVPTVEQHVQDILAVMRAAGSPRADFVCWADAAFMAAMLAATHPERVSALVLGGLWIKSLGGSEPSLTPDPNVVKALSDSVKAGWREGMMAQVVAAHVRLLRHPRRRSGPAGMGVAGGSHRDPARRGRVDQGVAARARDRDQGGAAHREGRTQRLSTVQMLVLGSGIKFTDRGEHTLKDVPARGTCSP